MDRHDGGLTCFVTGDFVAFGPAAPDESEQEVNLAAMIRPGFLEREYGESLLKAAQLDADLILPGHMITYEGDTQGMFRRAYRKYMEEHEMADFIFLKKYKLFN